MTISEMHIAVNQGVDKIHSFQTNVLLAEEIDHELNKNIMRFLINDLINLVISICKVLSKVKRGLMILEHC